MKVTVERDKQIEDLGNTTIITYPDQSSVCLIENGLVLLSPEKEGEELERMLEMIKEKGRMMMLFPWDELKVALEEMLLDEIKDE